MAIRPLPATAAREAMMLFDDRYEAGRRLAARLRGFGGRDDVVVLALPRGGVPVAYEVATALRAPLDVVVSRKLGVPGHEELAMGALSSGGVRHINRDVVRSLGITDRTIESVAARERAELERRERRYRGDRPPLAVEAKTVILIDDGIATGATMRSSLSALGQLGPARVIVAVPHGAGDTVEDLGHVADEVVCLATPEPYVAVGAWYRQFPQVSDAEVQSLLEASRRPPAPTPADDQGGARR